MEKPTQLLGQPKETAAREQRWRGPDNGAAHAGLLPQPRRLTGGARALARETGEKNRAAAKLIAGDLSDETIDATVFVLPVRT